MSVNDINNREKKAENRKRAVKLFALIMFAAAVVVFSALGWFSANKQNTASGASININNNGFELAVDSGDETYRSMYTMIDNSTIGDQLQTGTNDQTIWWRMESADSKLQPGSRGKLEFYVTPNADQDIEALKYLLPPIPLNQLTKTNLPLKL